MQRENKVEVTERWSNGELVEVKANGHTIYPQKENKWQDRVREALKPLYDEITEMYYPADYSKNIAVEGTMPLFKSLPKIVCDLIQSEIDTAIAEERDRVMEEIIQMVKTGQDPYMLLATENRFLWDLKNLITKEQ